MACQFKVGLQGGMQHAFERKWITGRHHWSFGKPTRQQLLCPVRVANRDAPLRKYRGELFGDTAMVIGGNGHAEGECLE